MQASKRKEKTRIAQKPPIIIYWIMQFEIMAQPPKPLKNRRANGPAP